MSSDSATRGAEMNPAGHFTAETVADYRLRRLDPVQILALHDHANGCAACRQLLADEPNGDHLGEVEVVDYVAGKFSSPGIEAHLAQCAECREVVDDLRAFQASQARRGYRPMYLAAAAAVLLMAGAGAWVMRPHQAAAPLLVSSLNDGAGVVGITASGDVTGVEGLTDSTRQLMKAALQSGRLPTGPTLASQARGTLRTDRPVAAEFHVISPMNTREYSDRPVFKWTSLPGAGAYEVVVFDTDLNEVARSGKVIGTEWQPAEALPRQRSLEWQVAAERNGKRIVTSRPPEPAPVFEIISAEAARSIAAARAVSHPSHLALALIYAREGLRTEEAAEVAILAAQNPHSPLVESLQRNTDSIR